MTARIEAAMLGTALVFAAFAPPPAAQPVRTATLREYTGVYRWQPDAFVYLQLWNEFTGFDKPPELVAFDEAGEIRTLYPSAADDFFSGPGMAISSTVESRIHFDRDAAGHVTALTWERSGAAPRHAQRVDNERHEEVRFGSGDVRLAGTLIAPSDAKSHPAIVLVHGSGAEDREYMVPWAHFLVRRGFALLGYDKRGVGGSSGDWNTASFDDLAGDVVAAVQYLKTRHDIDGRHIGLLGLSQAGWVMPIAAVRSPDVAFLVSLSGAGVPPAETTLDQARNEMRITGTPPQVVDRVLALMTLQYEFARTGKGWDAYAAARNELVAKMGQAPPSFPGNPDDPYFGFVRRIYFYDPLSTLRRLRTPVLALWGELDNNVVAEKNRNAWDAALSAAGNRDYTLRILPKANHALWEAKVGSNAEEKSLSQFAPGYFTTVREWLAAHARR